MASSPKAKLATLAFEVRAKLQFISYANATGLFILILIQIRTQGQEANVQIIIQTNATVKIRTIENKQTKRVLY